MFYIDNFIKEAIEEGGNNIYLVNFDVLTKNGKYEEYLLGYRFYNGGERFLIMGAILLLIAINYLSNSILKYITKTILF